MKQPRFANGNSNGSNSNGADEPDKKDVEWPHPAWTR